MMTNGSYDTSTTVLAVIATVSPLWIADLNSNILIPIFTILGITWLLVQIFYKIKRKGL